MLIKGYVVPLRAQGLGSTTSECTIKSLDNSSFKMDLYISDVLLLLQMLVGLSPQSNTDLQEFSNLTSAILTSGILIITITCKVCRKVFLQRFPPPLNWARAQVTIIITAIIFTC